MNQVIEQCIILSDMSNEIMSGLFYVKSQILVASQPTSTQDTKFDRMERGSKFKFLFDASFIKVRNRLEKKFPDIDDSTLIKV